MVTLPAVAGHVAFWVIILGSAARRFLAVSAGPLRLLAAGALALRALNSILRARD